MSKKQLNPRFVIGSNTSINDSRISQKTKGSAEKDFNE